MQVLLSTLKEGAYKLMRDESGVLHVVVDSIGSPIYGWKWNLLSCKSILNKERIFYNISDVVDVEL